MSVVKVERYGTQTAFYSDMETQIVGGLDVIKAESVRDWRSKVAQAGLLPYGEPEVRIVREVAPMFDVDPETGEEFRLPDSCCMVVGSVVPNGTPLPDPADRIPPIEWPPDAP